MVSIAGANAPSISGVEQMRGESSAIEATSLLHLACREVCRKASAKGEVGRGDSGGTLQRKMIGQKEESSDVAASAQFAMLADLVEIRRIYGVPGGTAVSYVNARHGEAFGHGTESATRDFIDDLSVRPKLSAAMEPLASDFLHGPKDARGVAQLSGRATIPQMNAGADTSQRMAKVISARGFPRAELSAMVGFSTPRSLRGDALPNRDQRGVKDISQLREATAAVPDEFPTRTSATTELIAKTGSKTLRSMGDRLLPSHDQPRIDAVSHSNEGIAGGDPSEHMAEGVAGNTRVTSGSDTNRATLRPSSWRIANDARERSVRDMTATSPFVCSSSLGALVSNLEHAEAASKLSRMTSRDASSPALADAFSRQESQGMQVRYSFNTWNGRPTVSLRFDSDSAPRVVKARPDDPRVLHAMERGVDQLGHRLDICFDRRHPDDNEGFDERQMRQRQDESEE